MDDPPGIAGNPYLETFYLSLKMMKIFTCILVCDDGGRKRRLSEHALSPRRKKRDLRLLPIFFMSPEPEIDCKDELLKLDSLMEEALAKHRICWKSLLYLQSGQDIFLTDGI